MWRDPSHGFPRTLLYIIGQLLNQLDKLRSVGNIFTIANAPVPGLELCSIGQGPEKWAQQLLDSEEFLTLII